MIQDIYQYSEESIVLTLKDSLGESQPIIRGYQGSPEPDFDYLVVTALDVYRLYTEQSNTKTADGLIETNLTYLKVMLDITAYGESAYRLVQSSLNEVNSLSSQEEIHYKYGISINSLGQVKRNPELRGTDYVQRCTTTLELTTTLYHSRDVDWFDTVNWEGTYKTIDGKVVLEDNQTVPSNGT